jgi:hypothetical protein
MAVNLGSTAQFSVLAYSGITNSGPTVLGGSIGTFPTVSETGFPPGVVLGTNHAGDSVTQQAKLDLNTAYLYAQAQPSTSAIVADLGGTTLPAGVYTTATSIAITGTLTLDGQGNPNAVWIFQAGSTLTTAAASQVVLINGAQESNIFWQVGSSATLGTTSHLDGTILAMQSISLNTGATIDGRALALNGAVTLLSNTITMPVTTAASNPTIQSIVSSASCFMCLDNQSLLAIRTLALYNEAKALGYNVDNSINGIANVAACYASCVIDEKTALAAEAQIAVANANLVGANMGTDTTTLFNAVQLLSKVRGLEGARATLLAILKPHQVGP